MSNRNELPFAGGAIGIRFMIAAGALLVASAIPAAAQVETYPPLDTGYVIYDDGPINLALGVGLRVPSYNRVDGVAVGWGPDIRLAGGTIKLAPSITYRSHIGAVDPSITGTIAAGPLTEIRMAGGRSTFSNDTWIKSDLMNSLSALGVGSDARNYFRADRGEVEIFHRIVSPATTVTPSIGVLHEFAWSTGMPEPHTSAPWSFFGAKDDVKMRRINPAVIRGHTTSGLGGLRVDYELQETKAGAAARVEHAFDAPLVPGSDSEGFTQYTVDARAKFPTFGLQTFTFKGHAVFTGGMRRPRGTHISADRAHYRPSTFSRSVATACCLSRVNTTIRSPRRWYPSSGHRSCRCDTLRVRPASTTCPTSSRTSDSESASR